MLVQEKKYKEFDLIYESKHLIENNNNFIILDDKTNLIDSDLNNIFSEIEKYGFKIDIVDINNLSLILLNQLINDHIEFDSVLTVGTGGLKTFENIKSHLLFKNKNIYNIEWHREWDKEKSLGFQTNINNYDIKNKNILIIEDVTASGNTIWTLKNYLESNKNTIVQLSTGLIQESSPILKKSFCKTFSAMMICKPNDENLDPFWYPPIYSLRHLLYGDDEMDNFYKILNKKYFNNESIIENLIKQSRR